MPCVIGRRHAIRAPARVFDVRSAVNLEMDNSASETVAALGGVRVLDLSRFIAGPLCCQILGDMGAEVIKVERPGGEDARRHQPMFNGHSIYTMIFNRNKYAITLDTRHADALSTLEALVAKCDIVVENYRPGTLEQMGLPYERMRDINPRITVVSISGFGQTGPNRNRALFDAIAQAESGLMSLTGEPDGEPMMTGTFIGDYVAAFHAAMGAMTALLARVHTGRGQHVDIACFDALFSTLGTHPSAYVMNGQIPARTGNRDQITVPANVFPARDGHVYIHAGTDALFPRLARAMGRADLIEDERFADQGRRLANVDEIDKLVGSWSARLSCDEIAAALGEAGVPFGKVASVPEVAESAQVAERDMLVEVEHPLIGTMKLPGIAIKLSDTPGAVRKPPPLPGEDNDRVYGDLLGFSEERIAMMRSSGLI